MKYFYLILVSLFIQANVRAEWVLLPIEGAVKKSDLIVIGTLKNVKEFSEKGMDYGDGSIVVGEVLHGKIPGKGKKISLVWSNRTGLACPRVEQKHKENIKGIWLLTSYKDGKFKADNPMRFQDLKQKDAIKKLLVKANTSKLWGISGVKINKEGSVTLVDARKGNGHAMWFPDGKGGFKPSVTLKKGESCKFIDGDHAFMTYKLDKIENGIITFTVINKFDARSFGDKIKIETKTIRVSPY